MVIYGKEEVIMKKMNSPVILRIRLRRVAGAATFFDEFVKYLVKKVGDFNKKGI